MSSGESPASALRFLVDENLPRDLVAELHRVGHEANHVLDIGLRGRPDDEVFAYAQQHGQTIVTSDIGFGNIFQYPPPHAGIVVARLPDILSINRRLRIIMAGLALLSIEGIADAAATIEVGRVRIHR